MTPPHKQDDIEPGRMTQEDIAWVHAQRRQTAHEDWLRGQIKVIWPWVIAVITALVALLSWVKDHVKL